MQAVSVSAKLTGREAELLDRLTREYERVRESRGIFRHFLRYITLTIRHWETDRKGLVDTTVVKEAVTVERLAEDMELELAELFPKQSDLRLQAVRLLLLVEESGPRRQTELVEELGMEDYAMSRLLAKLEPSLHCPAT